MIVPAYNEAERLPSTLRRLQGYLSKNFYTYEILVVLDGPTDATLDICRRMSGEIDNLKSSNAPSIAARGMRSGRGC